MKHKNDNGRDLRMSVLWMIFHSLPMARKSFISISVHVGLRNVSTLLQMFANGNAPNEDAKAILREVAEGVQVLGTKAGLKSS